MESVTPITFKDILINVPSDDLGRTWPAKMTIMMRMTSKLIRDAVDEGRIPVAVSLNWQIYINNIPEINCIFQLLNITSLKIICFDFDCIADADKNYEEELKYEKDKLLKLSEMITLNNGITKLDLSKCLLEDNSIFFLKNVLPKLQNLSELNFDQNHFSLTSDFIELLMMLPKLVRLILDSNSLFNEETIVFGQILHLEELSLRYCDIPRESYNILKLIEVCPKLVHLDLGHNALYGWNSNVLINKWIKKLPQVLGQCHNLTYLDLSNNIIDAGGAMYISTLLKSHNLVCLKLSHNILKDEGVTNIANSLSYCSNLTKLDLSNNKIQDKGVINIVNALLLCPTLSDLDLSSNKMENKGASCIAQFVTQYSTLTSLNLSCNQIKNGGAAKIENVLKGYHSLTSLYIYGNHIKRKEYMKLQEFTIVTDKLDYKNKPPFF